MGVGVDQARHDDRASRIVHWRVPGLRDHLAARPHRNDASFAVPGQGLGDRMRVVQCVDAGVYQDSFGCVGRSRCGKAESEHHERCAERSA